MTRILFAAFLLLPLAGCSGSDPDAAGTGDGTDSGDGSGGLPPGNGDSSGGLPAGTAVVYAHTATDLFRIDPTTLAEQRIGAFGAVDALTDIAVDGSGALYGVTYGSVVRIDATTAVATELSRLDGLDAYVGLSFLSRDDGGAELLVGTTQAGAI